MRQEDQVIISFGSTQYVVPAKAGLAIFAALAGADVYVRQDRYESVNGKYTSTPYITLANNEEMPKLQHIGPVQFHIGLENQRVKEEQDAKNASAT